MTKSSIRCETGDVVLVRFPFTDQSAQKLRPAVVISPPDYHAQREDLVLLALTTQPQLDGGFALSRWQRAGLPKPTWAKPVVMTFASTAVIKIIGSIDSLDDKAIIAALRSMIAVQYR